MIKKVFKIVVIILYAFLLIMAFITARRFSFDSIESYSPKSPFLTAIFILGLYALKSISIFFPMVILHVATGFLFPTPVAILLNILGTAIMSSLPFYMGKLTGADFAKRKIEENDKIRKIIEKQKKHQFSLTFFLRIISCLPGDIVSMYLGTLNFNFPRYLVASILGILPGLIPATIMGQSITEPLSKEFLTALGITLLCTLVSIIIYYIYDKKFSHKK